MWGCLFPSHWLTCWTGKISIFSFLLLQVAKHPDVLEPPPPLYMQQQKIWHLLFTKWQRQQLRQMPLLNATMAPGTKFQSSHQLLNSQRKTKSTMSCWKTASCWSGSSFASLTSTACRRQWRCSGAVLTTSETCCQDESPSQGEFRCACILLPATIKAGGVWDGRLWSELPEAQFAIEW